MKIDESCINHNALRLIHELASDVYENVSPEEGFDNARIEKLGEIRGICVLATALKDVLKS